MAEVKWIKLSTDMFNNSKIRYLRKLPDGDTMILFWVMLLTKAGRCNSHGYILLTENIPYDSEMLASEFELPLNTVKMSLASFQKLSMIEIDELDRICISDWGEHQSLDKLEKQKEQNRLRKQRERERKKQILLGENIVTRDSHAQVTGSHATEQEQDKEVEQEVEQEVDIDKQQQYIKLLSSFKEKEFKSILKYLIKNNVDVDVVEDKLKIIDSMSNIRNRAGALICAIRENWSQVVENEYPYGNYTGNNKKRLKNSNVVTTREYDEFDKELFGWDKSQED